MINSTTEILNKLVETTAKSPGAKSSTHMSQLPEASQKLRKEFVTRYGCMQSYFLRSSWLQKIKLLTEMLEALKNIDSLSLVLNTLRVTCSKSTIYAGSQYSTNFVYDKALQDHDRTMHEEVLIETQEENMEWFKTLEDSEQILMLIGLIRLGGGSIMQQLYERGAKLYHQRVQEAENTHKGSDDIIELKTHTPRTNISSYNLQISESMKTSIADHLPTLAPRILNIKPTNEEEFNKYDPKDPFVIEVEQRRKIWNDTITKYRIQVEVKPPKSPKGKEKKGGKEKSPKSGKGSDKTKSDKKSKSDKSGKKGEKGKKGKGNEDEIMDQIQLLPIWIVKKIFSYLDAKTLKKAKTVNKYWAFAIADLQKEQKARKYLDKFIRKMEASVLSSQIQLEENPKVLKEVYDTSSPKKRLLKLSERGAVLPKLKANFNKPLTDKNLTKDAVAQLPESYILPLHHLDVFPRSLEPSSNLYKVPSCFINELGFTKISFKELLVDKDEIDDTNTVKTRDNASQPSVRSSDPANEEAELKVAP